MSWSNPLTQGFGLYRVVYLCLNEPVSFVSSSWWRCAHSKRQLYHIWTIDSSESALIMIIIVLYTNKPERRRVCREVFTLQLHCQFHKLTGKMSTQSQRQGEKQRMQSRELKKEANGAFITSESMKWLENLCSFKHQIYTLSVSQNWPSRSQTEIWCI